MIREAGGNAGKAVSSGNGRKNGSCRERPAGAVFLATIAKIWGTDCEELAKKRKNKNTIDKAEEKSYNDIMYYCT